MWVRLNQRDLILHLVLHVDVEREVVDCAIGGEGLLVGEDCHRLVEVVLGKPEDVNDKTRQTFGQNPPNFWTKSAKLSEKSAKLSLSIPHICHFWYPTIFLGL